MIMSNDGDFFCKQFAHHATQQVLQQRAQTKLCFVSLFVVVKRVYNRDQVRTHNLPAPFSTL